MQNANANAAAPPPDTKKLAREVEKLTEAQKARRRESGLCVQCGILPPASMHVETCRACQKAAFGGLS